MDLQELSDRLEVQDLLTRYATAVDRRDWDLYRSVFTPGAHIDYTSAGGIAGSVDEIVAWLDDVLRSFTSTQHLVANIDLTVEGDGDVGRVSAMFHNPMRLADGSVLFTGGWYHHDLIRTPRGWRSARLVEESAWFSGPPSTPTPEPGPAPSP